MDNLRVATVPGSKSITNRALLLAALSNREYLLQGAQFSDDSRYFLRALKDLGFSVREDETAKTVCIRGLGGRVPKKNAEIYVGSAGTAARFLTAMLACSDGTYTIRASEQMTRRPMKPLFDALTSLGAEFAFLGEGDHLPVRVRGIFWKSISGEESPDDKTFREGFDDEGPVHEKTYEKKSILEKTGSVEEKDTTYEVSLDIHESTQYLSALLMTASMLPDGLTIHITSEKKRGSYIEITRRMMEEFGIPSEFDGESYRVKSFLTQSFAHQGEHGSSESEHIKTGTGDFERKRKEDLTACCVPENRGAALAADPDTGSPWKDRIIYQIEPDVSAACYFYAAAMLTGGSVQVRHVHGDSMQGDRKFLGLLKQMGATVEELPEGICVTAPEDQGLAEDISVTEPDNQNLPDDFSAKSSEKQSHPDHRKVVSPEVPKDSDDIGTASFPGIAVNMNDFSDQAITLAALAPFASSPTVITGIAHIRRQESDRLGGITENLRRMGIRTEETEDSVKIWPGQPKPCEIETYDDHRMAMGFALVGLRVPGMKIRHPECCRKTFKEYFDEMEKVFGLEFSDEK